MSENVIMIVDYSPEYARAFKELNVEWITTYFEMEANDYKALDNPDEYIINEGGHILVALYNDRPVGVVALIKMDHPEYDYELAKMAVSPKQQGLKIGTNLGYALLDKARILGAKKVFLESNTILEPAIHLYRKLGFKEIECGTSPYQRANIQMVCDVN
jgi:GNAT superfamily N-acetyltransferase